MTCKARIKEQRAAKQRQGELNRNRRQAALLAFTTPGSLESVLGVTSLQDLSEDAPRTLPLGLTAPVFAMAPMVKQSGRAFRELVRAHGCTLCYSEMLMADEFARSERYRQQAFGSGVSDTDHPLVVQFAANDSDVLLQAGLAAQAKGADAIDINLGCPQQRARDGGYGAWLAADVSSWAKIAKMVQVCASSDELTIPVFCKIRLQSTLQATVDFATMLEDAGCAMLAVHGRQLVGDSQNRRRTGAADLDAIRAVRAALHIPVLSNGNVRSAGDVIANQKTTHCEGIMVAEQLLRDPAVFERALFDEGRATGVAGQYCADAPVETVETLAPVASELADELLLRSWRLQEMGESFTVWGTSNAEVVRRHLKAIYIGSVSSGGSVREEWFLPSSEDCQAVCAAAVGNPDQPLSDFASCEGRAIIAPTAEHNLQEVNAARRFWRDMCF